jgi:Domain of unknown function (DUF1772)
MQQGPREPTLQRPMKLPRFVRMKFGMEKVANVLALLSSGLLAGAFAYGFFAVVPTFYEVPLVVHLNYRDALMRHNGIYMQIAMAASILAPIWWAFTMDGPKGSRWFAISASLLSLISFIVTRFGNVPINRMIRTWSAVAPPTKRRCTLNFRAGSRLPRTSLSFQSLQPWRAL